MASEDSLHFQLVVRFKVWPITKRQKDCVMQDAKCYLASLAGGLFLHYRPYREYYLCWRCSCFRGCATTCGAALRLPRCEVADILETPWSSFAPSSRCSRSFTSVGMSSKHRSPIAESQPTGIPDGTGLCAALVHLQLVRSCGARVARAQACTRVRHACRLQSCP